MAYHRKHDSSIHGVAMNNNGAALALLFLGAVRQYAYKLAPPEIAARAWNITGACVVLALVLWLAWRMRSRIVLLVVAWWAAEESLTIGCNTLWLIAPWPVTQTQDICRGLLDFDLGKLGALMIAIALALIVWK